MVVTRMMTNNIQSQVKSVMNDIVGKVSTVRKVSFTMDVVSKVKEFEVYGRIRKTPPTKVGGGLKKMRKKKPARCIALSDNELREINTPILCRTTPIPLSVIWKYAEQLRQEKKIDFDTWKRLSEIPHKSPEKFTEDIYP
jgi:hypothetical protein